MSTFFKALVAVAAIFTSSAGANAKDPVKNFTDQMMGEYERNADDEIQNFCADKWPNDYALQDFCYRKNVEARNEAQAYDLLATPGLMPIWSKCVGDWEDEKGRPHWEMINFCMKEQVQALNRINARKKKK